MLCNWNIIIVYLNSNINFCYFLLMKCIQWIIFFIYNTVITILYELEYSIVIPSGFANANLLAPKSGTKAASSGPNEL